MPSNDAPTIEGTLWSNITQIDAAKACYDIYTTATTDLINSYSWDTALVYIQSFSGNTDYSYQDGKNINSSLTNTGANRDERCKINDMASNCIEWTTEYSDYVHDSTVLPFTQRGGHHDNLRGYPKHRFNYVPNTLKDTTFRSILYI